MLVAEGTELVVAAEHSAHPKVFAGQADSVQQSSTEGIGISASISAPERPYLEGRVGVAGCDGRDTAQGATRRPSLSGPPWYNLV